VPLEPINTIEEENAADSVLGNLFLCLNCRNIDPTIIWSDCANVRSILLICFSPDCIADDAIVVFDQKYSILL
jgi:hypothetical protein